ncbi:MAG TPA: rhombosortase [Steroidobacter sp.]
MSEGFPGNSRVISPTQAWWLLGLLIAAVVLPALGGAPWQQALRYEREAVLSGEVWRLVTGHFVHGSLQHLILNGAGLALIALLFGRDMSLGGWLLVLLASMAAIDVGFVFFEPQLDWYVGLSGVLHGALAAGAIAWWHRESKVSALVVGLVLAAKLLWEQGWGALPFSGDMPVIVDAHLYGALGGGLAAMSLCVRMQDWPRPPRSL